ncbi:MAG: ATP-binding protein [Xanthomonadales bacterium]|nr:ATP-binding protein [Xanthomonadales bacterium]
MRYSLKFKVGSRLVVVLAIAVFIFSMLLVSNNREELMQQVTDNSGQLSRVVISSTRFAMLQNQPSHVDSIIQDVGDQADIEKVRILSKEGVIIHSSQKTEIGRKIDMEAEACLACHLDERSRLESPMFGRSRFFTNQNGKRMLGSTAVIHNEPTCTGAGCHKSPAEQPVLGVLDIIYPLNKIESTLRSNTYSVLGLSFGFIILAGFLVSYLVHRLVYLPLNDLDRGAERLAAGNLDNRIPVRSKDEFGHLARSFNSMTKALRKSRVDLEDWGRTLEQKVEAATQELHKAQAESARSEKLASVGLLAAGIAHELNNPLTGVLTFSYLVRKNLPDDSPDAEDLDLVIRETKRCASIIRRLLDFSREKTPEKTFCDLNTLIEDTVQLVAQAAQLNNIEITRDLSEQLTAIWLDEDLIKQVIMNMLVNAQHAIESEGRISIRTRQIGAGDCPESIEEPGDMAEITITDTGSGIPEDDLQRIFDPFFTTKGVGKGTGLGLSVSHGTIEAHGGVIEVESTVGKGTEFRIYLPLDGQGSQGIKV